MDITLEIPDAAVEESHLPEPELRKQICREVAVSLYAQNILSLGRAAELAKMDKYTFGELVGQRGIPRHYSEEDLALDLAYVRSQ
jgi:predicted HTH domain antitoxin